jgi:hypothetical protein
MKLHGNIRAINSVLDFFYSSTVKGRRKVARAENRKRRSSGIVTKSKSLTSIVQQLDVDQADVTMPSANVTSLVQHANERTSEQTTGANTERVISAALMKENHDAIQARTEVAVSADKTFILSPTLRTVVAQILSSREREAAMAHTPCAVCFEEKYEVQMNFNVAADSSREKDVNCNTEVKHVMANDLNSSTDMKRKVENEGNGFTDVKRRKHIDVNENADVKREVENNVNDNSDTKYTIEGHLNGGNDDKHKVEQNITGDVSTASPKNGFSDDPKRNLPDANDMQAMMQAAMLSRKLAKTSRQHFNKKKHEKSQAKRTREEQIVA